jgi:hypothetical protein
LCVFQSYRKLKLSLKLDHRCFKLSLSFLLLYNIPSIFLLHLPSANHFFKIFIITIVRASNWKCIFRQIQSRFISSHQYCNFFLFGLLIFAIKLKYTNSRVYYSYCKDKNVANQCVSRRSNPEHFNRRVLRYLCRVHIFSIFVTWRGRFMLVWRCSLANSTSALVHGSTLLQQVQVVFL